MPETGFTTVVCQSPGCGHGDPRAVAGQLFAALRLAVRESRHGVLVSAGCLLGPSICGARATAPMVLVQACDAERRAVAPAMRVGPLRTVADVDALAAWLRAGDLDLGLLPAHLLTVHRRAAAAPLN